MFFLVTDWTYSEHTTLYARLLRLRLHTSMYLQPCSFYSSTASWKQTQRNEFLTSTSQQRKTSVTEVTYVRELIADLHPQTPSTRNHLSIPKSLCPATMSMCWAKGFLYLVLSKDASSSDRLPLKTKSRIHNPVLECYCVIYQILNLVSTNEECASSSLLTCFTDCELMQMNTTNVAFKI